MKYLFTLILIAYVFYAHCQSKKVVVSGKIVHQQNQEALEFATISFQDVNKPDFLTGGVSDENGNFSIELPAGTYHIKVEFLSFQTYELKNQTITSNRSLGNISLTPDPALLESVDIVAEKTTTEFRLDKKIFNVGKDLVSQGGSLSDVLQNVPSVTVDVDGAINLRGNNNVRILINGKPSILANNGLDQIPANSIERIEVITNPSARYEAQGSAGIINIVLKKNSLEGLSGSLQLRAGIPADHRPTLNLNYKAGKFNLFGTFGYRYSHYIGKLESNQWTTNDGVEENLIQRLHQDRYDHSTQFYIGGDYYLNEYNTLTLSAYRYHNNNEDQTTTSYAFFDQDFQATSTILRNEAYSEPQTYNQWELNYVKTFKKKGQKLTISTEYDFWDDDENESISDQYLFPSNLSTQSIRSRDIESSKDFLVQTDYVHPVSEKAHIELGFRGETRVITSDYVAQNRIDDQWQTFDDLENELDYFEKIGGAYVQYGKKLEKLSYLIGIRSEYTAIRIEDIRNQYNIEKNYLRFFPTLHISYTFSEDQTMQLSYSRRINRPSFWQLNPFGGISDFRNLNGGNPDLDPAYTNALELGLLHHSEKLSINPSVYYQFTTDFFFGITQQLENGNFFRSPTNQSQETRWGVEFTATYHPVKWWTLSGDFNFFHIQQEGRYKELDLSNTNESWQARLNSRMQLPHKINIQATVNVEGRVQDVQTTRKTFAHADFAISKDVLKEKATLTLNIRNAFNSRTFRWTTVGDNFWQNSQRSPFGRRWAATFTYRFNQKKNQRERRPSRSNRA
ncbi:MAG: TonB-dependent receptor domain-containing protein [Flammeovirgaceae bacterium]